jgi:hypothetical protein
MDGGAARQLGDGTGEGFVKFIYVVTTTKWKTQETTVLACFENKDLAGIYAHSHSHMDSIKVHEVPLMDGTPEMNEIVLSVSARESLTKATCAGRAPR